MVQDATSGHRASGVTLTFRGEFSKEELHQTIDQLAAEEIGAFTIEIETDAPLAETLPGFEETGTSEAQSATTAEPAESETDQGTNGTTGEDTDTSVQTPTLQPDSGAYNVAKLLADEGGWLRAEAVRNAIPEDWDIPDDTVGSTLWQLADRDLLEKRPYEQDKRQTEYRITDTGTATLERVSASESQAPDTQDPEAST